MSEAWSAPVFVDAFEGERADGPVGPVAPPARAIPTRTLSARMRLRDRRHASAAWVSEHLARARRTSLTEPRVAHETTRVGLDVLLRRVTWRGARVIALGSIVAAAFAHAGLAVASGHMRPQRARPQAVEMAVATAQEDEVLADEAPPPPPPVASRAPSLAPSASPSSAPLASPSLGLGVAGGLATPGFTVGGSGGSGGAADGSGLAGVRPIARAAPVMTPAKPVTRTPPRFPPAARARGTTGHVVVSLLVDETGAVRDARVLDSAPPGVFDAAAIAAVQRWRFEPARADGQATSSWVKQTVRFELE